MSTLKSTKAVLYYKLSKFLLWFVLSLLIGFLLGTSSALFLSILDYVTTKRIENPLLLLGLPFGGLFVGILYYYFGGKANEGNNLLLQEYHHPIKKFPFLIAPLVLIGTWITHLFGGSAGREGTAIQIGATIADQFTRLFKLNPTDRQTLLLMGVSGGFASVFGTPLAGTLFALELMAVSRNKYIHLLLPLLLTSIVAHYVCISWGITHTSYLVNTLPILDLLLVLKVSFVSVIFGLTAILFVRSIDRVKYLATLCFSYPPIRPFIGGILIVILYFLLQESRVLGLGIETIVYSFTTSQPFSLSILKILFTAITLGTGFKGGEVTPLFFIGATLGSALACYLQLPVGFIACLGFVAVFSGATKTPLACILMAGELFGSELLFYAALSCLISTLVSGKHSIYKFQLNP